MFENTLFKLNKLFSNIEKKDIDELRNAVFDIFIEADVPYNYTTKIVDKIGLLDDKKNNNNNKNIQIIGKTLRKQIINTFKKSIKKIELKPNKTNVVGVFGINGVGKTSFIAKFANYLNKKYQKSIVCVSFDDQRPTGKEQLMNLCKQIGVKCLYFKNNTDGIKVVNDIINKNTIDVLLIDTAGLNPKNKTNTHGLLNVIQNISFDEKILVVDGTLGQNAVDIIKLFRKNISPTGVVVSKTETDKKGGVFFSIRTAVNVPIYFITKGEKISDIDVFDEKFVSNVLCDKYGFIGSCDNNKKIQQNSYKNKNNICVDYVFLQQQFVGLTKQNAFSKMKLIFSNSVSVFGVKMTTESYMLMKKWIAIIQSMTKDERLCFTKLNVCRINRIAKGAGVAPSDVVCLKKKLEEINQGYKNI